MAGWEIPYQWSFIAGKMVVFMQVIFLSLLWKLNEHEPFMRDLPGSKMTKHGGFSIAMFDYQRVTSGFPYDFWNLLHNIDNMWVTGCDRNNP